MAWVRNSTEHAVKALKTISLGDSYNSPAMLEFISLVKDMHEGIFVHSVFINDELDKDRQASLVSIVGSVSESPTVTEPTSRSGM
jgi:hypothetical protein